MKQVYMKSLSRLGHRITKGKAFLLRNISLIETDCFMRTCFCQQHQQRKEQSIFLPYIQYILVGLDYSDTSLGKNDALEM